MVRVETVFLPQEGEKLWARDPEVLQLAKEYGGEWRFSDSGPYPPGEVPDRLERRHGFDFEDEARAHRFARMALVGIGVSVFFPR